MWLLILLFYKLVVILDLHDDISLILILNVL